MFTDVNLRNMVKMHNNPTEYDFKYSGSLSNAQFLVGLVMPINQGQLVSLLIFPTFPRWANPHLCFSWDCHLRRAPKFRISSQLGTKMLFYTNNKVISLKSRSCKRACLFLILVLSYQGFRSEALQASIGNHGSRFAYSIQCRKGALLNWQLVRDLRSRPSNRVLGLYEKDFGSKPNLSPKNLKQ